MRCNQSGPGFELVSPCPYPATITIAPRAPHKQSDGTASVMLEHWGTRSTSSLLLLPGPLWPGVVAPNNVLSIGQIELTCNYAKLNCLKWTVFHITMSKQNCTYTELNRLKLLSKWLGIKCSKKGWYIIKQNNQLTNWSIENVMIIKQDHCECSLQLESLVYWGCFTYGDINKPRLVENCLWV